MKLHLKLFLCLMLSLGQVAGEDPFLHEVETPGTHQEPETLIAPGMMHKEHNQVPADEEIIVFDDVNSETIIITKSKPTEAKKIYVDEKCCNLSTTPDCLKRGGDCVPNNETCHGKEYFGSKYCVISNLKSCKCCVPTDCEKATLEPCKLLNGTCKGAHEDCEVDESSVSGAEFCKYKNCKCCFPKDTPPCPCGQDFEGGCRGNRGKEWYKGLCMKTCEPETTPLQGHKCDQTGGTDCKCCASTKCPKYCVGVYKEKEYDGFCRFGGCLSMETKTQRCLNSNCDCCINVTESCEPPTCNYNGVLGTCSRDEISGMVDKGEQDCKGCRCWVLDDEVTPFSCNETNPEEHDCSHTETEFIGGTPNVASTSSVPFTSGMTLGIRMLPQGGQHELIVYVEAPGYPDGVFKIRLQELTTPYVGGDNTVYHWIIHRWSHNFNPGHTWSGNFVQCIPKNEWLLLTITDLDNGYVKFELHGYYSYQLLEVSPPNEGVTIRVDTGSNNLDSEISLSCPPKN